MEVTVKTHAVCEEDGNCYIHPAQQQRRDVQHIIMVLYKTHIHVHTCIHLLHAEVNDRYITSSMDLAILESMGILLNCDLDVTCSA